MTKTKVRKILFCGIGIVLICIPLYYLGFGAVYCFSMKKANKEAIEVSYLEQTNDIYSGKIKKILRYEYDEYMNQNFFGLDILTNDSTEILISYQYPIKLNENLLEFVEIGQKIKKAKGKDHFELTSKNGISKTFKVPNCEK